jgi:ankyrin repeat protein
MKRRSNNNTLRPNAGKRSKTEEKKAASYDNAIRVVLQRLHGPNTKYPLNDGGQTLKELQTLLGTVSMPVNYKTIHARKMKTLRDKAEAHETMLNAVKKGNVAAVEARLTMGERLSSTDFGRTLEAAIRMKNAPLVDMLLRSGIAVPPSSIGLALTEAAQISRGAVHEGRTNDSQYKALMSSLLKIVRLLLQHGADANTINHGAKTASCLQLALIVRTDTIKFVRLLLEYRADPNRLGTLSDQHGNLLTPLLLAVLTPDQALTRLLLDAGADPNTVLQRNQGVTTLTMALANNLRVTGLEILKDPRTDVDTPPGVNLNVAMKFAGMPLVRSLLERGATIPDYTRLFHNSRVTLVDSDEKRTFVRNLFVKHVRAKILPVVWKYMPGNPVANAWRETILQILEKVLLPLNYEFNTSENAVRRWQQWESLENASHGHRNAGSFIPWLRRFPDVHDLLLMYHFSAKQPFGGIYKSFVRMGVPRDRILLKHRQSFIIERRRSQMVGREKDPAPPLWIRMTPRGNNRTPLNVSAVERANPGSFVCGPHICNWCAHAFKFMDNMSFAPKTLKTKAKRDVTLEAAARKMLKKAVSCARHGIESTWFGRETPNRVLLGDRATHTYLQKVFPPMHPDTKGPGTFVQWMTQKYAPDLS